MEDKDIILTPGAQGAANPTDAEIAQLENMLEQEAIVFVEQNGQQVFQLGKDYITAILFQHAVEYVGIPELSANPSMQELVDREQILKARNLAFQLVSKAELAHWQELQTVQGNAQTFLMEVLHSAGIQAGTYLLKILAGMALAAIVIP